MEYLTWRELVLAYVFVKAWAAGWAVKAVQHAKSTRSVYVVLKRGAVKARIRVSDHKATCAAKRRAYFCVQQHGMGRLGDLHDWLAARAAT